MTSAASEIRSHTLSDGDVSVTILSMGAATQDWRVPDGSGRRVPVVLGYADPAAYATQGGFLGVIVGRVANRIAGSTFTLDGVKHHVTPNEGPNQLHGGPKGWWAKNWTLEADGDRAVQLTLSSPDGDMGFPGSVQAQITISLDGHRLTYDMSATCDRPTPINLANHNYYNLMGNGLIWDHQMQVNADRYTPTGGDLLPIGDIAPVEGTKYDYRQPRRIADADPARGVSDINFALNGERDEAVSVLAQNGLQLRMWTDQPGLQFYTGQGITAGAKPLDGQTHAPCHGIALEPQGFPDAVNQPNFPSVICTPEKPYKQVTTVEIAPRME
ncbi:MAG: aldose epimerase family protein [Pseudomonadota bacterium]|nr:aldose epimerase family protein [Pseudomonadota bacterium]